MHRVWSILEFVSARPWYALLYLRVDFVRLGVHLDLGPIRDMRSGLVSPSSRQLLMAFSNHTRSLAGTESPLSIFMLNFSSIRVILTGSCLEALSLFELEIPSNLCSNFPCCFLLLVRALWWAVLTRARLVSLLLEVRLEVEGCTH